MTNQAFIERAETARDLKDQMNEALGRDTEQEFQFYEWSPGRTIVSLWSMETGEEIRVPRYIGESALYARNEDGGYRFTTDQSKAPERRLNSTKCLFHKESPMRPFLEETGIIGGNEVVCRSEHLAGESAMLLHAENKHADRFKRYVAARERIERAEDRKRQLQQTEAMLKLANANPGARRPNRGTVTVPAASTSLAAFDNYEPEPEPVAVVQEEWPVLTCEECGKEFATKMAKAHLSMHKKREHSAEGGTS